MDFVKIAGKKIPTLLALTSKEQEKGLMHRDPPAPVMSFVYSRPSVNKFWMKDVKMPLDIVFAYNEKIVSICSGEPYSTRIIGEDRLSDLVVEFPLGTCKAHGISVGDPISLEYSEGSLMRIFQVKNGLFV